MKNNKSIVIATLLLICVTIFSFFKFFEDDSKKNTILKQAIFESMRQVHYNEIAIDDDFSVKAFYLYIKRIDRSKQFLLSSDVKKLEQYKTKIDDEASGKPNPLLDESISILKNRLAEAKSYYKEFLSKPFNYDLKESLQTDNDKINFSEDKAALKDLWRKRLKHDALVRYVGKIDTQKKEAEKAAKENKPFKAKSEKELEAEVRKQMLKNYDNWFDRMEKLTPKDRLTQYINAILNVYGPHTTYYPPQQKENFDISMSGQLEGIGAQLQEIEGNIKVFKIVPGSASWRQKQLKKDDIILKVAQGDKEPVDVSHMPLNDAVKMIRGKKGTEVRLTVKKPDGTILIIPIIRDVVIIEDTYAKSVILEDKKNNKKYGYILLPGFYADFNQKGGRNSADDIRKELTKLKAKNVDGVIMDLRSNGGGSLTDAIKMVGHFIKTGPVVQVKGKRGNKRAYPDNNPEVAYDGPLAVMVHKFSASASEIFSAALQDYNRAIIIGSPSTYGKGTVQRFIDLDQVISKQFEEIKPLGSLKLTFQKFYRINGEAMQNKGVVPDILLPETYNYLEVGEKYRDYAFSWDKIPTTNFSKWQEMTFANSEIVSQSNARVAKNTTFKNIENRSKKLKKKSEHTISTLNMKKYLAQKKKLEKENKKHSLENPETEKFNIISVDDLDEHNELDSIKIQTRKEWYKQVNKDIYIQETTNVLLDLMNTNQSKK